jgi:hypothetical protein
MRREKTLSDLAAFSAFRIALVVTLSVEPVTAAAYLHGIPCSLSGRKTWPKVGLNWNMNWISNVRIVKVIGSPLFSAIDHRSAVRRMSLNENDRHPELASEFAQQHDGLHAHFPLQMAISKRLH